MRVISTLALLGAAGIAVSVGGCSGGGNGISTSSVLDGAQQAGATTEVGPIKPEDPKARVVQVAWTAARAQRCGFIFDPAKLKANFLAAEATRTGPTGAGAATEKVYDQTFASISVKIKADPDYCSKSKNGAIKADLQRHLAGNYDPNFPQEKKVASSGFFDGLVSDDTPDKFNGKTFWDDMKAKKDGAKSAQISE